MDFHSGSEDSFSSASRSLYVVEDQEMQNQAGKR